MSLIRYTHPALGLQRQLNRMFDSVDADLFGRLEDLGDGSFAPAIDVKEDEAAYTVELEVPGLRQEQLDLSLQDNVLTIKGTKERQELNGERYRRVERPYGSFARSVSLPRSVDETKVTANLQAGVLVVHLPKRVESKPKRIEVSLAKPGRVLDAENSANALDS